MNEAYILYCITIIILSSFKLFNKDGYNLVQSMKHFSEYHIKESIIIPILHFIYSMISSIFFFLLSGNLKFSKLMKIVYNNLTKKQYTYFGLVIYSLEIITYFLIAFCYFYIFTVLLTISSNIQNGDASSEEIKSSSIVIIILIILLVLHNVLTSYFLQSYKNNQKEFVQKLINMIKNMTIFS